MLVNVRPSNEALLRTRVPGAQTNVGVLPILFIVRVLRARMAPGRSLPILRRARAPGAKKAPHAPAPHLPSSLLSLSDGG
jgi:hypothetical protein